MEMIGKSQISYEDVMEGGLLLHACCGPCATWPLEDLAEHGVTPELYYYNPNIHPEVEWQRRLEALETLAESKGLELHLAKVWDEHIWRNIGQRELERCRFCYTVRLRKVAEKAKELGMAYFTTTLLVSPYQKHDLLHQAGALAEKATGVRYIAADWTERFRYGQDLARQMGLYRQKYCGCCISLDESKFNEKILREHEAFVAKESTAKVEDLVELILPR